MDDKVRDLLANVLWQDGLLNDLAIDMMHDGMYFEPPHSKVMDKVEIREKIMDFLGVPADTYDTLGYDHPESMCRDWWLQYEIRTIEDAYKFLDVGEKFVKKYQDNGNSFVGIEKELNEIEL